MAHDETGNRRPPQYQCRACLASARGASLRRTPPPEDSRPRITEVQGDGLTWIHVGRPTHDEAQALADRFGWHPLDIEDVMSRRQRPKVDVYTEGDNSYLFAVLHFPVYDRAIGRLNAGELDVFVGADYLVTFPTVELRPVTLLFRRCFENEELRHNLFARGSGRLFYEVLDDLYDYCFPILDKIGYKLEQIDEDIDDVAIRAKDLVRDIHKAKQEIISYRKIIKPQRPTLRQVERGVERFLPEDLELYFDDIVDASERIWDLLDNYKEVVEALRDHERVAHLAPAERHPVRADDLQRRHSAAHVPHRSVRHERELPRVRQRDGVLGDPRLVPRTRRVDARVLPVQALALADGQALGAVAARVRAERRRQSRAASSAPPRRVTTKRISSCTAASARSSS